MSVPAVARPRAQGPGVQSSARPVLSGKAHVSPRRRASLCCRGSVCYSDRLHGIRPFLFLTALPGRGAGIHVPRSETLGSESRFQVLDQQG